MKKLSIKKELPIRKKVYNHLREQILNGLIPPNEQLSEARIAREIGTSRTPVREALHNLELEKLIRSIPSVGYVVAPLTEQDVEQLCEIREVIESLAARWAMEKAHQRLVQELSKNIASAENATLKGNLRAFIEFDAQFHEIISGLSGSEHLFEMSQFLRRRMLRYRTQSIYTKENVVRAIKGHKGILKAIESADTGAVGKAIKYHLDQSLKDILRFAFRRKEIKGNQ
jgi:DNA-binding GntR family transcriptional regulator